MSARDALPGPLVSELAAWHRPQFIVALLVPLPNSKTDKIPVSHITAAPINHLDPANWLPYEEAARTVAKWGPQFRVSWVLTPDDPYFVVDIDNALQPDGTWSPLALELCAALPGCVVEISQSGRGLHICGKSRAMPEHARRNIPLGIECYSSARHIVLGSGAVGTMADDCPGVHDVVARYFPPRETAASTHDGDGPRPEWQGPTDDDELIRRMLASRSAAGAFGGGVTPAQLWHADAEALGRRWPADGRPYDASSADAAMAQHLAWWTGCDQPRMNRLMRQSGLRRDKYDREDYLPRTIANACAQQRDVLQDKPPASAVAVPAATAQLTFAAAAQGWIDAKLETVFDALQSSESGIRIALDRFLERPVIGRIGEPARPFEDADYGEIRAEFGRRGFKPIAAEIARTAVVMAARRNAFDSAHDYVNGLQWDGVRRIDAALPTYFRTADTPYTRAVGAYLFTALAGRALVPGVQVDMVPVLVGMQGERKSTAVQALSPHPDFFTEVNLRKLDDDNTARLIRGKLVGEIAELRGLFGRDQESIKAWITRRTEHWVPKFIEFAATYPRRIVFIGTTNEAEFLDDPSGERRWLPVVAGRVDIEALERDREQLWAEGAARFKASGVAWQDAERLARAEHEAFKVRDPWCEPIERWLAQPAQVTGVAPGTAPFRMADVCLYALGRTEASLTMPESKRVGKVLRGLGYESRAVRIAGRTERAWVRAEG